MSNLQCIGSYIENYHLIWDAHCLYIGLIIYFLNTNDLTFYEHYYLHTYLY